MLLLLGVVVVVMILFLVVIRHWPLAVIVRFHPFSFLPRYPLVCRAVVPILWMVVGREWFDDWVWWWWTVGSRRHHHHHDNDEYQNHAWTAVVVVVVLVAGAYDSVISFDFSVDVSIDSAAVLQLLLLPLLVVVVVVVPLLRLVALGGPLGSATTMIFSWYRCPCDSRVKWEFWVPVAWPKQRECWWWCWRPWDRTPNRLYCRVMVPYKWVSYRTCCTDVRIVMLSWEMTTKTRKSCESFGVVAVWVVVWRNWRLRHPRRHHHHRVLQIYVAVVWWQNGCCCCCCSDDDDDDDSAPDYWYPMIDCWWCIWCVPPVSDCLHELIRDACVAAVVVAVVCCVT
mmetsp:Transcript_4380/g.9044  ORF Transcript_4380/g.9044 Transcript_4380/m.9044 type:complete len:340 (-) Transcript_4380:460-1479(-)